MRLVARDLSWSLAAGSAARHRTPRPLAVCDAGQRGVPRSQARTGRAVRAEVGIAPKSTINGRVLSRAIRDLYATNQFEDVAPGLRGHKRQGRYRLHVRERRVLSDVKVQGARPGLAGRRCKDRVDLLIGKPIDPAQVAKDVDPHRLAVPERGLLSRQGARSTRSSSETPRRWCSTSTRGAGSRFPASQIIGNKALSSKTIVGAIGTKPEGFFWWRNGEFDQDKYAEDLAKNIPQLYASHGYIDAQVVKDTLIIDRDKGKALVRLTVSEGPQYKIGDVRGQRRQARFSNEEIAGFYPFGAKQGVERRHGDGEGPGRARRRRRRRTSSTQAAWQDATDKVKEAYDNEGYIYSSIQPVIERRRVGQGLRADGRSALGDRRAHAGDRQPHRHRRQRRHDRDVHSRSAVHAARATCSTANA